MFPNHFSFLWGEVALYSFVVLLVTGTYLTLFFEGSQQETVYEGSYEPLQGTEVSAAFDSVMRISFDVKGGLLIRQMHHWAALVFVGAIALHMARVFFTGAFRRPREINWVVGVLLLILALAAGFTGYSLPDDLLSGTGLRITHAIILAIPFIGERTTYALFGGEWPGTDIIGRLYPGAHPADPGRHRRPARPSTWRSCGARSTPSSPGPGAPSATSSGCGCGRGSPSSRSGCCSSSPA